MKIIEDPRSYAFLMAILASFLTPFVASSINVALPSIGLEFAMDPFVLAWVPTVYLLAVGSLLIPMGRLADIYGRRRIFQFGIILFTVSSIFAGFSISAEMLLLFKVIQGIGGAMIFSNISAIIFSVFPPVERGYALGWSATGTYFGLFFGPALGGFLTRYFGWRSIFYFNVPLSALCAYAIGKIEFEWREAEGERFDFLGAFLMASSLILIIVGFSLVRSFYGLLFFILGVVLSYFFYRYEVGYDSPLFDVRLFENRSFIWNGFTTFISYFAGYPVIFLLSLYLQYFHGLNPWKTGMILAIQPILIALVSPVAGKLSDKKSPKGVAATGIVIIIWAMVIFSFLGSLYLIALGLVFMGLGFAFFSIPNSKLVMEAVERRFLGVASATLVTFRVLGQLIGMALIVLFVNIYLGGGSIAAGRGSFQALMVVSFISFILLLIVGLLLTLKAR
ncbi:MAG TPA: MFS transporter [Methanobacteriales archaeon]|nr:MAG: Major facilitator superfamily MFS_1 [Methanobacteriaceae archaeon 41_258]MBC7089483.1 MFS transporter [Methanobacteriaceae archaeon]MBC7096363.1 MFS transporter [Methanobacteriales archaeon]HIH62235.1 MFS transporter [Methanobacteriales archaeon]